MSEELKLSIPANSKYVSIVRMVVSGLASKIGFSSDAIEDIKVAVSEACNNVVQYAYPDMQGTIDISLTPGEKSLSLEIRDTGKGFDTENPPKRAMTDDDIHMGLGLEFIKKLMTNSDIISKKGEGTTVLMTKEIA